MPPPKGTPGNFLEGPGDYDVTSVVHCNPYPAIDPSNFDFSGKAVLVTGASRGLGRAMVLAFAAAGASKIAAGARGDTASLKDVVASSARANGHAKPQFLPLALDVADEASVGAAAVAIRAEFGRLDVVVNNAGILGSFGKVGDTDPGQWWRVFQVNLLGPYLVSRAMVPLLRQSEYSYVIHVASVGAHLVNPALSAYQTSKAALVRFSQLLDREYSDDGVTSFSVHPGNCQTDIMGPGELDDYHKSIYTDSPALCAQSLVYLTSEPRPWLGGRYVNCTWDLPELMAQKDAIVEGDKLKVKLDF
ncbi:short chain dehydrogenase reductase [Colletotrichum plurivorum]|uniref:Short chain dehydrogenase reductase n=1 Tax=Colletotrichum plurivorum TaxID=2175906 RepID=A0A8H6MV24_9PEZI|nr:short chain dehydrogenase reductase [Colletotrichum plurivorum]